jgi:CCR4-NOT transcription complex subunit 6
VFRREKDAVLIGYKKDKFEMLKTEDIRYNDLCHKFLESEEYFRRHNVGKMSVLKNLETGTKLVVVNTHMFWNSNYDYIKYAQGNWLMKCISQFINKNGLRESPLVLCGDFNSTPVSSLAHLINNQEY